MCNRYTYRRAHSDFDYQRGTVSVEYAVVIVFLILLSVTVIIQLVDPTGSVSESVLPGSHNAVSQKIGQFGTLPE